MWIVKENYVAGTVNDLANKLGLSLLSKRDHIEHNNDHKSICRTKLSRYVCSTVLPKTSLKIHCLLKRNVYEIYRAELKCTFKLTSSMQELV